MEENAKTDEALEKERLSRIVSLLSARLSAARAESKKELTGLQDTRRDEFTERSEPLLRNLWAAHRFEDLVHLSQEFQNAADEEKDHASTLQLISSLEKMLPSPYFARIDLAFEEDEPPESVYIGRHSLWDDAKENLLIYDWRSPIASVFYRCAAGPAAYTAPAGKISCRLLLKRQFEIQQSRLIGYFDADTVIQDSFLRRLLAQNASAQMKSIVETIQKDQDAVIRDEDHDLLMVQGAAGSGKTSIAMHRAAYLMYEGLKNPLHAHNILILSPNTVFEKYISGVLPELGESSVSTTTLEQLLEETLGLPVQSRMERWESICASSPEEQKRKRQEIAFKGSAAFLSLLEAYARALPRCLDCPDLCYAGSMLLTRQQIRSQLTEQKNAFPLSVRLRRLESALWEQVHALRPARFDALRMKAFHLGHGEEYARGCSIWESGVLARQIHALTRLDIFALYRDLLKNPLWRARLGREQPFPPDLTAPPLDQPVPLEDAAAMAYLRCLLFFGASSGDIRQVLVDEAQDYTAVDYALLSRLFPKASYTVVGDRNQALEKNGSLDFYEIAPPCLKKRNPVLLTLSKSFRCTSEILRFSLRYRPEAAADSFNRPGAEPRFLSFEQIEEEIGLCRSLGYQSIALVTKTKKEAERLLTLLPARLGARLMGRHARLGDVFLAPLPLSKGLEFDAVLLLETPDWHADEEEYGRLMYVGCTRALHRLAVVACPPLEEGNEHA